MFLLSSLPLSTSNTHQLNGIESDIILHVNELEPVELSVLRIINIDLFIEQDKTIIL